MHPRNMRIKVISHSMESVGVKHVGFLLYKLIHCHIRPRRLPFVSIIQSGDASEITFKVIVRDQNIIENHFYHVSKLTAKTPPVEKSPADIMDNLSMAVDKAASGYHATKINNFKFLFLIFFVIVGKFANITTKTIKRRFLIYRVE